MPILALFAIAVLALTLGWAVWRLVTVPCPSRLAWLLDNPFTSGYQAKVVAQLRLEEGMAVLDAGCGPGRLTIPIAQAIGPAGRVLAVDIQEGMISRVKARTAEAGLSNVEFLVAPLGSGKLPQSAFDRAVMVTVLGEIPDKLAALREIQASLKPGGFLSVTEVLPDPHYRPFAEVRRLAERAGFQVGTKTGGLLTFTVDLEKPGKGGPATIAAMGPSGGD